MGIKADRARSLALSIAGALLLTACATTQYSHTKIKDLTDQQLVTELHSAATQLGLKLNQAAAISAMRPAPQYVLASSTSFTNGQLSTNYNAYSMPGGSFYGNMSGSYTGNTSTSYHYVDANAGARLGNAIALAIARGKANANRKRLIAVEKEIKKRREERQQEAQATISQFFADYPNMRDHRVLFSAIYPWVAARYPDMGTRAQLKKTRDVALSLNQGPQIDGRWFGVINQVTTLPSGKTVGLHRFVTIAMHHDDQGFFGQGRLASGDLVKLYGQAKNGRFQAIAVNETGGINVNMKGNITPDQIAGNYQGAGPNGALVGSIGLYR